MQLYKFMLSMLEFDLPEKEIDLISKRSQSKNIDSPKYRNFDALRWF